MQKHAGDSEARTPPGARLCPRCYAGFCCQFAAGKDHCWCFDLPNIVEPDEYESDGATCICPTCLRGDIARQLSRSLNP